MTKNIDLLTSSYHFDLPEELIAQRPVEPRDHSRLLVYNEATDQVTHAHFFELEKFLPSGCSLVFNKTKVKACRLFALKPSGGKAEIFILKEIESHLGECLIKSSGKKKLGDKFIIGEQIEAIIEEIKDGVFWVRFNLKVSEIIDRQGTMPIPPYIRKGLSDKKDESDYQTVYAEDEGSVATPTAGLHFTPELLERLRRKGFDSMYVTLHVGMGTFAPVKADDLSNHKMHTEEFIVDQGQWDAIQKAEKRIAVGTTSLRVLESLWQRYEVDNLRLRGETDIFLYPGVRVQSIDGLLTNFHLPQSTLLMLVSSLIGREKTLCLYKEAIKMKYRFFSYGDAMLILRKGQN